MAISTRTEASGANAFSLARMLVPTGDDADRRPLRRHPVGRQARPRRRRRRASLETLAAVAAALPTSADHPARPPAGADRRLRHQQRARRHRCRCTSPGAQLLENYPVGPLAGVAFNLTLLSYNHSLDMGVNIDTAAVAEPELLRGCLERAFKDLVAA